VRKFLDHGAKLSADVEATTRHLFSARLPSQQLPEQLRELSHGLAAVAQFVLEFGGHLGDSRPQPPHEENGVVSEAVGAPWPAGYDAFDGPCGLEQHFARLSQGEVADEPRVSLVVGHVIEGSEQFFGVRGVAPGAVGVWREHLCRVARAVHAGLAVQGIDHKPRIVGKAPSAGGAGVVEGFLAGVFREGDTGFLGLVNRFEMIEAGQVYRQIRQNLPYLPELSRVSGGQDYFLGWAAWRLHCESSLGESSSGTWARESS